MSILLTATTSPYIIPALIVAVLFLLIVVLFLYHKIYIFTRGKNGKSLESTVRAYLDKVDELKKHDEIIAKHAFDLDNRLAQCIRNVSTVRYKAFDQNSSNQSFAIALVNEKGDGVLLSSLHHRDRVSIFAKPLVKYTSTYDLTEEELSVLEESKKAHKSNL